ncbi:MAG: hypothetical protein WCN87_01295 [Chlamydiota bacterium]
MKNILVQGSKNKEALYHIQVSQNGGTLFKGSFEEELPGMPFFQEIPENIDVVWLLEPNLKTLLRVASIPLIIADITKLPEHDKKKIAGLPIIEGIMIPGSCRLGTMPPALFKKGSLGLISRSKSLAYEAAYETTKSGVGQSLVLVVGEGSLEHFRDILKKDLFTKEIREIV